MDTPERIKETKEHDDFKTAWCLEHQIPLIRISYLQYNTLTLSDLLLVE